MHWLSKSIGPFRLAPDLKLQGFVFLFMPPRIIRKCRAWVPRNHVEIIGGLAREEAQSSDVRILKLVVEYHPLIEAGL